MTDNNLVPRLCGFVISSLLSIIVLITSWHSGLDFEYKIQIFVVALWAVWGVVLLRAKGWLEYSRKEISLIAGGGIFLGLFFTIIWNFGDSLSNTPLVFINKEVDGIHRDSLYHSALAYSIAVYGYPSLLVNSAAFHNYHFGSHYILGMISRFMDVPAYFVYGYIYPILFFPLYTFLIFGVGSQIRNYIKKSGRITFADMLAMMIFMTNFILPTSWADDIMDWKSSFFTSESFHVGNVVCLLFFYLLFWLINNGVLKKRVALVFFLCIITPLFIVLMSLCKISVGVIFVVAVVYYLLRNNGLCTKSVSLCGLYMLALLAVHYIPTFYYSPIISSTTGESYVYRLLNCFMYIVKPGYHGFHILLYFLPALVFVSWRLKSSFDEMNVKYFFASKKYIVEETLLLICIVGYLPDSILAIGGSGFYFSSLQQLYATVLIIGYGVPQEIYEMIKSHLTGCIKMRKWVVIFVLFCLSMTPVECAILEIRDVLKNIRNSRIQYMESIKDSGYWYTIGEINRITNGHKGDFYIYVSPSANIWKRFKDHDSALFFYPAMTGVVSIGELYFDNGKLFTNDGLQKSEGYSYKPLSEEKKLTVDDAYNKAKADGKKGIIYVNEDSMMVRYID